MNENKQEQPPNKKSIFKWVVGGGAALLLLLGYINDITDIYEKLPFSIKIESKTNTNKGKITESETVKAGISDVEELDNENDLEELVKSKETYRYRIRVITYTSENPDTYKEKIEQAQLFVNELNEVLISGKYDKFIDKEERKIPENAFFDKEEKDKDYIYVYINESTGTSVDMVEDVKTLNRKYEAMFNEKGWLRSGDKWKGLIIDYSDSDDMKNQKTLSPEDLFEMAQLLY